MVSFIILLIARTARIACPDRQTERQTDRQNDKPSTVTLAAHARRGLNINRSVCTIIEHTVTQHVVRFSYFSELVPSPKLMVLLGVILERELPIPGKQGIRF